MQRKIVAALAVCMLVALLPLAGQDLPQQEKRENVQYYQAMFLKFKPGMADQAFDAIYQHFVQVDQKLERKVKAYDLQTGEWDMVVFFPIDGPEAYSWITSPMEAKWFATLAELEGGADKAHALFKKFYDAVAKEKGELAHRHLDALPD